MKALFRAAILLAGLCAGRTRAEAVDATASLEYLFAPAEARWGTGTDDAALLARAVHCLKYIDGRIYVGAGEWNDNAGPVPIVTILPGATPSWTNEYAAGSEQIEDFKKFSDGRVWTRATDAKEHDANYGFFFVRDPDGTWSKTANVDWNPFHTLIGGSGNYGTYTHVWDFCEYGTNLYFTGFGIAGSPHWLKDDPTFSRQMGSVTTGYDDAYGSYRKLVDYSFTTNALGEVSTNVNYETKQDLRRFVSLFPFENGCVALTCLYYNTVAPELNEPTLWRLSEADGRFHEEATTWDAFFNGWRMSDGELRSGGHWGALVNARRITPFRGRLYYIVTQNYVMGLPLGAFSAAMDADGAVSSERLAFEDGLAHPIDFAAVGGSLYVMTVRRNSTSDIEHGIWKTRDGASFEKLATVRSDQYFESFTYAKGHFYLGYGRAKLGYSAYSRSDAQPATDKAGQIWRFALPQADDDGSDDGPKPYVPIYDAATAWYLGDLGVTNLLDEGITGRGVKVGVVDTGIGDIVTGTHTNLACAAVHGVPSGAPHGTGVEGIIASDVYGIAPECELYAYEGTGFVDDVNGIWWCLTNGCKVVNFSGGYTPFDYTDEQLAWARRQIRTMIDDHGLVLVAAGGNAPNETLSFPQDMEGVINVAGVTRALESAGLNDNWAKDFCAFGQNVPVFTSRAGATGVNGGSSFAAPMATGVIALLLQQNPSLTRDEIYGILLDTCRKLAEGRSKVHGFGLVQAAHIPANYKTQAQIDAEKATFVRTAAAELLNNGLDWNETSSRYEIKMYPGETRKIKYRLVPADATDRNLYWYCGNMPTFNPVGLDQVLTVPATTATGKFLVYEARNAAREVVCRLRVDVVAKGEESDPDEDDLLGILGGVPPAIAGFEGAGGVAVPALRLEGDDLLASVAVTVEGVYYTAFTAPSLDGPWTAAAGSWLSDGAAHVFAASTLDPATGEPVPALFLAVVASDTPRAAGDPL